MLRARWMAAAIAAGWMGVAGAQGAGSATPQQGDQKATGTESPGSGSSSGSTMSGSPGAMGASDSKATGQAGSADMAATLAKLHAGNEAEVQAGSYMQQQATNGKVKDFAKKMVDEHGALDKDAQQFAQKHNLDLTSAPEYQAKSSESQSTLEQLKSMQGIERDRRYMQMMVSDHQNDVSEVKQAARMAKQGRQDKEYATLLDKSQKKMEGHLEDAQKISRDLGSRQARNPASQ